MPSGEITLTGQRTPRVLWRQPTSPFDWVTARREDSDVAAQCVYDQTSPKVDLGDGLYMHEETWVVAWNAEWNERVWDIEIRVVVVDGRLAADSVAVYRVPNSDGPVTSTALRDLPIKTLVSYAINGVLRADSDEAERWGLGAWPTAEEGEYVATHGLDDTTLQIVARIYRVAYLIGDPPTKKVETLLQIPRSTAGRWVAASREAGYLSSARGPGIAGS